MNTFDIGNVNFSF